MHGYLQLLINFTGLYLNSINITKKATTAYAVLRGNFEVKCGNEKCDASNYVTKERAIGHPLLEQRRNLM